MKVRRLWVIVVLVLLQIGFIMPVQPSDTISYNKEYIEKLDNKSLLECAKINNDAIFESATNGSIDLKTTRDLLTCVSKIGDRINEELFDDKSFVLLTLEDITLTLNNVLKTQGYVNSNEKIKEMLDTTRELAALSASGLRLQGIETDSLIQKKGDLTNFSRINNVVIVNDVDASDPSNEGVLYALEKGIMDVDTSNKFNATSKLTVGDALIYASRIFCIYRGDFSLVEDAKEAHDFLVTNKVIPTKYYTNYDALASKEILAHLFSSILDKNDFVAINNAFICDVKTSSQYYINIKVMTDSGIMDLDSSLNFNPDAYVTRKDCASVAFRLVNPATRIQTFDMVASNIVSTKRPGMYVDTTEPPTTPTPSTKPSTTPKPAQNSSSSTTTPAKNTTTTTEKEDTKAYHDNNAKSYTNGIKNLSSQKGTIKNVVYGSHTYMCQNQAQYDAVIWVANQMVTKGTKSNKHYTEMLEKFKKDKDFRKNAMRTCGYDKWLKEDDPLLYELMKLHYAYSELMFFGNTEDYSAAAQKAYEQAVSTYGNDSAYIGIAYFGGDCTAEANVASLAFDALGYDSRVVGSKKANHDWAQVKIGQKIYDFSNGRFNNPKDEGGIDKFYTSWTKAK